MPHTKSKWVIVFLIYADFRKSAGDDDFLSVTAQMKATLNQMFKDMLTTPLPSERVRMYALINSLDYKPAGEAATQSKTLLYTLGNPAGADYNQIVCCKEIDSEDVLTNQGNEKHPVQNPELLKIVLKENIPVHEEEEVFMITWDHGSAFGIFREVAADTAVVHEPIYANLDQYPFLAAFWRVAEEKDASLKALAKEQEGQVENKPLPPLQIGHIVYRVKKTVSKQDFFPVPNVRKQQTIPVLADEKNAADNQSFFLYRDRDDGYKIRQGNLEAEALADTKFVELQPDDGREILHNKELAEALGYWLNEKPVGVLLMMNCWMMNLHTMYSLREKVRCLVAPQGDIGTPGYNYKNILRYLFKSENLFLSPQDLALRCVTSAENKRMRKLSKKLRSDGEDKIDCWKIFAVDLQSTEEDDTILNKRLTDLESIIALLLTKEPETTCFYKAMRQVCYDFSMEVMGDTNVVCMVDIVNWLHIFRDLDQMLPAHVNLPLSRCARKKRVLDKIRIFVDKIDTDTKKQRFILGETKGAKVYEQAGPAVLYAPTGFGLFFPQYKTTNLGLIINVKEDPLLQKNSFLWKQFIRTVYPEEVWKEIF